MITEKIGAFCGHFCWELMDLNRFRLGIIGAGNMGCAILKGGISHHVMSPEQVWLANPHIEKLTPFGDMGVHITTSNVEAVEKADIVLLAVKPQKMDEVLDEIGPALSGKCVVSIAAGVSRGWLQEKLPDASVICVMPNTPLMLGCGACAMTERGSVPQEMYQFVFDLFVSAGNVSILPDSQMNEIIPVSGSSPAFFFHMARVMVECASRRGIDPELALSMAAKTMEGAALMLQKSGKCAEELERQVCSPGGTTLAALTAFDEYGFDQMLEDAFERCIRRAYELGR